MTAVTRRVALTSTLVVVAFVAGAFAEDAAKWVGTIKSHRSIERFDMSYGVTAGQAARRAVQFEEVREVYVVPSHYGELVSVIGTPETAVFWYRDANKVLRNVKLGNVADTMYEIRESETSRLEVDARER